MERLGELFLVDGTVVRGRLREGATTKHDQGYRGNECVFEHGINIIVLSPVEAEHELERPAEPPYVVDFPEISCAKTSLRTVEIGYVEDVDDLEPERGAHGTGHRRLLKREVPVFSERRSHSNIRAGRVAERESLSLTPRVRG